LTTSPPLVHECPLDGVLSQTHLKPPLKTITTSCFPAKDSADQLFVIVFLWRLQVFKDYSMHMQKLAAAVLSVSAPPGGDE